MNDLTGINPSQPAPRWTHIAKTLFWMVLFVVFALNVFVAAWIIPQFLVIFHDMMGGVHLPAPTALVIASQGKLVVLSIALPLMGMVAWRFVSRKSAAATITISAFATAAFLQGAVTLCALLMAQGSVTEILKSNSGG